ncbi:MAG TPA: hypothetical protein VFS31_14780 [Chitinophagaceae bacterium]|nr:hypothetical protein [Chitinophagaceae bacterium]
MRKTVKYSFLFALLWLAVKTSAASPDSVRTYYLLKNKAEIQILDSSFTEALASYNKAFCYKYPNVLDVMNAFTLSVLIQDSACAKRYFNNLAYHGTPQKALALYPQSDSIKNSPFYQWLSADYDSAYAAGQKNVPADYIRVLDSLSDADQAVRVAHTPTQEQLLKILVTDSTNLLFLKAYIERQGFPTYKRLGVFEKTYEGWPHGMSSLWFMLWHTRHLYKTLNEILLDAVKRGELDPNEYALIMDVQAQQSIYYQLMPRKIDRVKRTSAFLPVSNVKQIDKKRASIYLDSLANFRRKLLYQNRPDKIFRFLPYFVMSSNFAIIDIRTWK